LLSVGLKLFPDVGGIEDSFFWLPLIIDGNSRSLWLSMFAGMGLVVLAWWQAVVSIGPALLLGVVGVIVCRVL